MLGKKNALIAFVKASSQNILDALNGQGGNFGFNWETKRFIMTLDDGQAPKNVASTDDIASAISGLTISDASTAAKGVTQIATTTDFNAGTDIGSTGAPLVARPSDIKAALDTKANVAGDLGGSAAAPQVQSSTTASALFKIQNVGATLVAAIKAVVGGGLQIRTGDDSGLADLAAKNLTVQDLTVTGNVFLNGTSTTVDSTNTDIKDNIISLNKGEPGAGVTAGESGFEVDRGSLAKFRAVWNETVKKFLVGEAGNEQIVVRGKVINITTAANPAATQHVLTHNLKTLDVICACWEGNVQEDCVFEVIDAMSIRANFLIPTTDRKFVITGV
jgi:hypothetical protein